MCIVIRLRAIINEFSSEFRREDLTEILLVFFFMLFLISERKMLLEGILDATVMFKELICLLFSHTVIAYLFRFKFCTFVHSYKYRPMC